MKWLLIIAVILGLVWFFRDKLTGLVGSIFKPKEVVAPVAPAPPPSE
jgi:hypothetical protein